MLRVVNRILPRATSLRALSTEKPKVPKKSKEEIMKEKTPAGKLDDLKPYEDPYLKKHPGGVNPITGEIGGPAGPEPTSLGLSSVRELEDIVIDAIYNKLIKARLDSKGQFIEVDDWASRDTPASNIPAIINVLTEFAQSAADVRQHTLVDADR
ncbi:hypothetical protein ANCCAN_22008 [Ancylostoma caninum]|uniref:PCI domain-containing protein n=1 Tax=Ancylostoma caninum TaxID=29170 RepID=A0A368FN20_ANCCA|nr:hypothetical protein ANCCAN_22008 [Ancylostoma caninum]